MNISKNIKTNQLISIVGATATGKTSIALALAKKLLALNLVKTVHLLSADSRQVYRGLENLTGADVPTDFTTAKSSSYIYPYFSNPNENIFLHGSSIIETSDDWSVAHFQKLFTEIYSRLEDQGVLIVVGGTGFYQQQIINPAESTMIPQNLNLRKKLAELNLVELQNQLKSLNQEKLENMNNSDLNNPRRLVRAIEIALYKMEQVFKPKQVACPANKIFYLELPKAIREAKIKKRVLNRFALAKEEVKKQLEKKEFNALAVTCTGFTELDQFIHGKINQQACLTKWQLAEIQYAKRQDTWWKKCGGLIRVDAEKSEKITDKIIDTCYI